MKTSDILDTEILFDFSTPHGQFYIQDSLELLSHIRKDSIDLIITSPPFLLEFDDGVVASPNKYIEWLGDYFRQFERILKPAGNIIMELGNVWKEQAVKYTHNYGFISSVCQEGSWQLLQEFFWYNPQFLNSPFSDPATPTYRLNESISIIWWISKEPAQSIPFAKLPSLGKEKFAKHGNLLLFEDTPSDAQYLARCNQLQLIPFTARFPFSFPAYFIQILSNEGDVLLDPFAGIGTTGYAAEMHSRQWICIEKKTILKPYIEIRFDNTPKKHSSINEQH